jgi:hypothetical protein
MKSAWETAIAYKMVWFRIALYFILPVITTFLTQTESMSGQAWEDTSMFLRYRMLAICLVPGFMAIAAFIDQSLARAREEVKRNSPGNTGP